MIWKDLESIIQRFAEEPRPPIRPVRYTPLVAFLIVSAPLDHVLNVSLEPGMVATSRCIDSEKIQAAFKRRDQQLAAFESELLGEDAEMADTYAHADGVFRPGD